MKARTISKAIHEKIAVHCHRGDELAEQGRFNEATRHYKDALRLVPQPLEDWEATTWILAAIGDVRFAAKQYESAAEAFADAAGCPGGLGNPFIHLRRGQCAFEMNEPDRAAEELARAYMGGGKEIFDSENPKYYAFLGTRMNGLE